MAARGNYTLYVHALRNQRIPGTEMLSLDYLPDRDRWFNHPLRSTIQIKRSLRHIMHVPQKTGNASHFQTCNCTPTWY